ncbi:MAG: hypothetical protein AVDCRST_MAG45-1125, partial [uncultured Solirubrobacterales bacterium]
CNLRTASTSRLRARTCSSRSTTERSAPVGSRSPAGSVRSG